ncbi:DUF21 domain-containing protein [Lactobacillus sp. S2-2]|uniref:hemolysin family protein n=1 Tax=Lactobacillus sp. S2-2 TaxID=2692917 RepID=UPI001F1B5A75|nr:hemolysin family protein [Lactobacillus sp. S2-2]MCF6515298.1 DUF21 domain-containing protein [Lactobacillus sp. S2-2]
MRNDLLNTGPLFIDLSVIIVSFLLAAFFVACEFALVQARSSAIEELLDDNDISDRQKKKLNRQLDMVSHLNEYLSTTQVGVTVTGLILGWIGESFVIDILVSFMNLVGIEIHPTSAHGIGAVVGLVLLTYIQVVFTEIVPKNISIDMPLTVLKYFATPLHYFHILFYPFVWLLNTTSSGVVRLFGMHVADENTENFSQAEILNLSKDAVANGALEKDDYLYMQRAFELNDKVAKDIMIDRTQLVTIDITKTVKEAIQVYLQERFSRLPVVANNDKDKILGYIFNYDLIRQSQVDSSIKIDKLIRNISTTSESTPITMVLQQMIKERQPIVVIIDEYGGTSGIITDKDIYEELFGTVRDEIDPSMNEYIFKQPNGTYQVNGKLNTSDFEKYFNTEIKEFDESDVVTLAGFIIENHHHIKKGDEFTIANFKLKVLDYENSFINWFEVTIIETKNNDENDEK